ncbi:MAG: GNAT family N-acetyltransferase [Rhodospirillaceae bacterium]|nr:GNAT family N-acetyltransferase [Rhodospirillaceae bacterium]MBT7758849.1 GNAT family N-acetyltransferase [Rhodospirillaceae bacterium]
MIEDANGKACGLFPIASHRDAPEIAISHPGATFGGLLLRANGSLSGTEEAFEAGFEALRMDGVEQLHYTPPPVFLSSQPNQIDIHLMTRYGAAVDAASISSVAEIRHPLRPTKGRKAGISRGARSGLTTTIGRTAKDYERFHELLVETLQSRHKAKPIHDLNQMNDLRERLGPNAFLILVTDEAKQLAAGCWVFQLTPFAWHTQYIASTDAGRACSAVEYMIDQTLDRAREAGAHYFSLGTSAADNNQGIDRNLFAFKSHFGFGSIILWRFLLNLDTV